jgi:1-acyl-sn-glycerol-3-phosphate acyltransferase
MGRMERGKQLVDAAKAAGPKARELGRAAASLDIPWARCGPARAVRETIQSFILGPAIDFYVRRRARGSEHFARLKPPVIMVANHGSHLDTPIILRALPRAWRQRTAVAAAADYFYRNRLLATAVSLLFNTVPVSRGGGGLVQGASDHIHRLIDQRWNLLLYPEGTRSRSGEVGKLRSGAAVLAHEHGIAIVPMHVSGTRAAMPPGRSWPRRAGTLRLRRHPVEVRFGRPIHPDADRYVVVAELEAFFAEQAAADESRTAAARRAAA